MVGEVGTIFWRSLAAGALMRGEAAIRALSRWISSISSLEPSPLGINEEKKPFVRLLSVGFVRCFCVLVLYALMCAGIKLF